ncbi:MAG TPA: CarD family transcriptional regulator, partial [Fervidobacterium sp.]|nr:CarD family transcriptional regulator [Fervidobacterium sp.]
MSNVDKMHTGNEMTNEIVIVPSEKETNIEGYYYIPDYDVLPNENLRPSWYVRARRIYALYLASQNKLKAVATLRSLLHYVMPPRMLRKYTIEIKLGDILGDVEELFSNLGYERVFNVREGGTFSIRGEIVDYVGPDNVPVRLELYGNLVEEIRRFDTKTQRTVEKLDSALILPAREFVYEGNVDVTLEPGEEQFTGKYVTGTFADYNVRLYVADKKSVVEHFTLFEREIRQSFQSEEKKWEYKAYGILDQDVLLSNAVEIELPGERKTLHKHEEAYAPSTPIISEDELQPGDIVVHRKYGIAKFNELKKVEVNGKEREFIVLGFSDSILYVPIERIDLIDKYVGDNANLRLDSLKKATWSKKVSKVKRSIQELVREMLVIQQVRSTVQGISLPGDVDLEE